MSDVDSLLASFADGSLVSPSHQAFSIVDLSRAIAQLGGASDIEPTPGTRALADLIGPSEHLVFVIIDGLGKLMLEDMPRDSFLANHQGAELKTVFPSTSASALVSIATGEWPNRHAIMGWWTHLNEIGGAAVILQFVRRSDGRSLVDLGVSPGTAFPVPPLISRIPRDTLVALPERIADSVCSKYISGGRATFGYKSFREAVRTVAERVRGASSPTYTYLYTDRLDGAIHVHGSRHVEVRATLSHLDRHLERLWQQIGSRARMVVSSDHGFLDVPQGSIHQVRDSDLLIDLLKFPPSGDARVLYLHIRSGAEAGVRRLFQERFGSRFLLLTVDDAIALELFGPGPLSPTALSRVGDLIAISRGPDVIEYRPAGGVGRIMSQASHHSGLTPSEVLVPLVVA